jgi:hypothetical protein
MYPMLLQFFFQISLCDDYSLPVDNLGNKKRPNSIAVPSLTEWNITSPNEEKVILITLFDIGLSIVYFFQRLLLSPGFHLNA